MNPPSRVPMTPEGHRRLEALIKDLKAVQRPAIMIAIEEARAHGDLRENAEYHAAKEKQALIEAQIASTDDKLARAQVIDPTTLEMDKVAFGATVTVRDTSTDEQLVYKIVGGEEADVRVGLISYDAPLARALVGKEEGDTVRFNAPKGLRTFEILNVEYK
jgi:transcription elongation factor GreA